MLPRAGHGTPYGAALSVATADQRAKAFRALREMGFRESEAKQSLARVPHAEAITLEALLRETLRELAPPRNSRRH